MKAGLEAEAAGPLQYAIMTVPGLEAARFESCIEQAEICCEQARQAARRRRYRAATGLFDTATALYERALAADGIDYPALRHRLRDIAAEKLAYTQLARSMAQPLLKL